MNLELDLSLTGVGTQETLESASFLYGEPSWERGLINAQDEVYSAYTEAAKLYYEPKLNVVIGRTPQIPQEQWHWLRSSNEDKVKIITFDDLLKEMRCRLEDRYAFLENLKGNESN